MRSHVNVHSCSPLHCLFHASQMQTPTQSTLECMRLVRCNKNLLVYSVHLLGVRKPERCCLGHADVVAVSPLLAPSCLHLWTLKVHSTHARLQLAPSSSATRFLHFDPTCPSAQLLGSISSTFPGRHRRQPPPGKMCFYYYVRRPPRRRVVH
jgi:hypothetical protein